MVGVRPSYNSAQVGLSGMVPGGFLDLPTSVGASRIVSLITTTSALACAFCSARR